MGAEGTQISGFTAAAAHAVCFVGLVAAHSLAGRGALVSEPAVALRLLVVCEAPIVIVVFGLLRRDPKRCSFLKAAVRGFVSLPVGAFLNAFGAIVLGAPVGIKYWAATTYWSLVMSLFTFVPAACVFGASKVDWQNALSCSIYCRPSDVVDYMISASSHGALIGAWLGAWPMPLDWERPWQEWPICVTYGVIAGYLIGMVVSLILIVAHKRRVGVKADQSMDDEWVIPIRCSSIDLDDILQSFLVSRARFPMRYLGLSLSVHRLKNIDFQPLLDKVAGKLVCGKFISVTGRTTYAKSVITSQAIHHLTSLVLPKGVLDSFKMLERAFLWAGADLVSGSKCKVSSDLVCRPTHLGGLGFLNMEKFARALRLRWPWLL